MFKKSRALVAAALVVFAVTATPVFAASPTDDSPILRRIAQIIRYVEQHLLPIIPNDEPTPPKP